MPVALNLFPCMQIDPHRENHVDQCPAASLPCKVMQVAIGILCFIASAAAGATLIATGEPLALIATVIFGFAGCLMSASRLDRDHGRIPWIFQNRNPHRSVYNSCPYQPYSYQNGNGGQSSWQQRSYEPYAYRSNDPEKRVNPGDGSTVGHNREDHIRVGRNN